MSIRTFASVVGTLYVVGGILGFIPGITSPPPTDAPSLTVGTGYGYVLGLFPVNVLHNFVHIGIGVWGLFASGSFATARVFAMSLTVLYSALAVMGMLPGTHTLFGFVPLFGHDVWLHAVTAGIAGYFAFIAPHEVVTIRRTDKSTNHARVYEERPRP